jgi:phage host-nuclease inhibitor protein Gam
MPPKKNATPVKPPKGSTLIHEESEDMSFRVSQLEKNFKGVVKILDLYNMEKKLETNMADMEKKLEESMETNMGNMKKKMEKLEESMETNMGNMEKKKEKLK